MSRNMSEAACKWYANPCYSQATRRPDCSKPRPISIRAVPSSCEMNSMAWLELQVDSRKGKDNTKVIANLVALTMTTTAVALNRSVGNQL